MERSVEARDLWDVRRYVQDSAYRCQVVWLVQRSQRYQLGQRSENYVIQPNWFGVMHSPMHDAMSDTDHLPSLDQVGSRSQQFARRGDMVEPIRGPVLLGDSDAGSIGLRQERKALGQHVSGFQVRHDQNIRPSRKPVMLSA